jgi:hypothetical protein
MLDTLDQALCDHPVENFGRTRLFDAAPQA